jgi:hypothetical protein
MNPKLKEFIEAIHSEFPGGVTTITRTGLNEVNAKHKNSKGYLLFCTSPELKIQRGLYRVPSLNEEVVTPAPAPAVASASAADMVLAMKPVAPVVDKAMIPTPDPSFVPFGDFRLVLNFVKSKMFYPIFISGESGNGKTKMVYEACAKAKRELIRANITETTDEDDLIGGFRLVNGETVWQDGPAVEAMKRGAVLLLDEVNLGSPKIMCLQPILEGNPIFVKKISKLVHPAPGFTVIATANTKGKGSDDGRYIGSNILNEAFLDRFAVTIEHDYPNKVAEIKILENLLQKDPGVYTDATKDFANKLVEWANIVRSTFKEGAIDEIITTRRLLHILNFYIYGKQNKMSAIDYCISRFDDETKASLRSLYQKVDDTVKLPTETEKVDNSNPTYEEVAF